MQVPREPNSQNGQAAMAKEKKKAPAVCTRRKAHPSRKSETRMQDKISQRELTVSLWVQH
jgi:hypothetical protein